jgi:L-fuculose-phosphate aldolase
MARLKHAALRREIIAACSDMNALGINQGTSGNVSARVAGGFLITPSGVAYDEMAPGQVVEMDLEGAHRDDQRPSSEWRMHRDIYESRPEAGAIVHSHATFCTALACLHQEIPAFHYMVAVAGGASIRCAGYATFGTQALSDAMLKALQGRRACLLANHGMICFGPDLGQALALAVEVETLARQYWHARMAGEPVLLSEEEMTAVLERFRTYGQGKPDPPG